ncbi:hypothetical protein ABW19_dt0210262 [Dactylella cylindrospora]|nr:hypothetical protein ABW19_dt0210262 [Dactylella cylindrospora]
MSAASEDIWSNAGAEEEASTEVVEETVPAEVPETDLETPRNVLRDLAKEKKDEKWIEKTPFSYEDALKNSSQYAEAPRWEWKEEFGEVAPRDELLEKVIFGEHQVAPIAVRDRFHGISDIDICYYNCANWEPPIYTSFEQIALHPVIQLNIKLSNYHLPTPIQRSCIPAILKGNDLIACAQTGSGKTAAFLIPVISSLMGKIKKLAAPRLAMRNNYRRTAEPLVLIIAPTRELATQIFLEARKFCYRSFMRPCVVYGGADVRPQRLELEKGCDLLVGTPGRLQDFIDKGAISLRRVRYTVVDEADELLDMGFEPQLRKLLHSGDHNEDDDLQVIMLSATFPGPVRRLAKEFLADDYIRINVGRIGSANPNVVQRIIYANPDKKRQATHDLLSSSPAARTLIFVNNKREADMLDDYLWNRGLPTTSIHGDRTQREREDALIAFRSGKCPILIATDVASRGLDIRNVLHVINYDLPKTLEEYTHRIGRTARMGTIGLATTFWDSVTGVDLAPHLVKMLMECNQEVPSFLSMYKPAEEEPSKLFDDEGSDGEDSGNAEGGGNDSTWGGDSDAGGPPEAAGAPPADDKVVWIGGQNIPNPDAWQDSNASQW